MLLAGATQLFLFVRTFPEEITVSSDYMNTDSRLIPGIHRALVWNPNG